MSDYLYGSGLALLFLAGSVNTLSGSCALLIAVLAAAGAGCIALGVQMEKREKERRRRARRRRHSRQAWEHRRRYRGDEE